MTIINIKVGFKITPFNSRAITLPGEDKFERFNPDSLAEQTGLKYKYIPICQRPSHQDANEGEQSNQSATL